MPRLAACRLAAPMSRRESIRSMPPVEAARRGLGELADEYPDLAAFLARLFGGDSARAFARARQLRDRVRAIRGQAAAAGCGPAPG